MQSRPFSPRAFWLVLAVVFGLACAPGASPAAQPAPAAKPPAGAAAPTTQAAPGAPTQPAALEPLTAAQVSITGNYLPFAYVADKKGFYAQNGLELELIVTDSSNKVVQAVTGGSADLVWTAPDAAILAIEQGAPLAIVAGGQNAIPYSLIVQPSIKSFADLRGKTLGTSSLTSGATVIIRKMMGANGLRDNDYDIVPAGGTAERYAAIRSGAVDGGLLLQPEDYMIMAEGFPRLAYATDYVPKYQWITMVVNKNWARDNEDKLVRALRAIDEAYRWVYDPRNRDEAIALITETTKAPEAIARSTYELYVDQLKIWPTAGEVDDVALRAVIELMGELGQLSAPLPEPSRYIDPSYLRKAQAGS